MDGSKKKVDYYNKAHGLNLVPKVKNMYAIDVHAFYHDVKNISPIVGTETIQHGQCLIIDRNNFVYVRENTNADLVQRTCKNLILQYNLKNL